MKQTNQIEHTWIQLIDYTPAIKVEILFKYGITKFSYWQNAEDFLRLLKHNKRNKMVLQISKDELISFNKKDIVSMRIVNIK